MTRTADIRDYLQHKNIPVHVKKKGEKVNFRRQCKHYEVIGNQLFFQKGGNKVSIL
jgi:hypothetical protein